MPEARNLLLAMISEARASAASARADIASLPEVEADLRRTLDAAGQMEAEAMAALRLVDPAAADQAATQKVEKEPRMMSGVSAALMTRRMVREMVASHTPAKHN